MKHRSKSSRLFDACNVAVMTLFALSTLIPFFYVIMGSFTTSAELLRKGFVLFPTEYSLEAYRYIFSTDSITRAMGNSVFVTAIGTLCNLLFTSLMAYPLSQKRLMGRSTIMGLIVFSMLFSGGMIPTFLVVKQFGLINSYGALIIPSLISAFNLILLKNFFQQIPEEVLESARIDGCNDLRILFQITLPLALPAIATFALFYAVGHWNSYFQAVLYLNDSDKWPIQVLLRQIVILSEGTSFDSSSFGEQYIAPPSQTVKMAVIVVATMPILLVYPFLQKHFAKGMLLGSVKG
ncbi:carbohydrate ABC transporter permease [Paenibacillus sp. HB172176]|uniref:carbohydrate ABC transporter permease n=1 Tax=Paenibacillus sp. HB172176 TaxID=2493690 RepID=UPI00143C1C18|nr:carbohydrate ABC transporter permease [Paenibacillus sp. HB172176]